MKPTTSHPAKPQALIPTFFSAHITDELRCYDAHLRDVRGLATGTRKGRLRTVGLFLQRKCGESAIECLHRRFGMAEQRLCMSRTTLESPF